MGQETLGDLLTVGWVKSMPFAYTWERRKKFFWEQLNVGKRFGINVLLMSSPTWIILWSCLWWMVPWISTSLAQTGENCPKPLGCVWQWKCVCSKASTIPCSKATLVVFCLAKLPVISYHSLLEDSMVSLRGTHACSHWDTKDLVLASSNSAMSLAHQVEAELLKYRGILQNYLCRIMWNCSVIETKNMAVDWHWGTLSCRWREEFASPWFGSPQSLLLLSLSVLTSHSTSRHKTDIAGHATSGFQQILYLE